MTDTARDGRVDRLFIGGPWDGRRHAIPSWAERWAVPGTPGQPLVGTPPNAPAWTLPGAVTEYHRHTAPTGEWAMLADRARWNEHVDTEAWPRLVRPRRAAWRKLGPWFWRGDGGTPETVRDGYHDGAYRASVTYLMADVSRSPDWIFASHLEHADVVDPRELALAALAGRRTAEDDIADSLRGELDWQLLPPCGRGKCTNKASERLIVPDNLHYGGMWHSSVKTAALPQVGEHIERACPRHASALMREHWAVRHAQQPLAFYWSTQ